MKSCPETETGTLSLIESRNASGGIREPVPVSGQPRRTRRGSSLVETLAAMALVTTAFMTVAVALHGMYRSTQHVRDELAADMELGRFADQFRTDAHQALSAGLEDSGQQNAGANVLSFVLPGDQTAQYSLQPRRIDRVLRHGDEVRHRETYRLPTGYAPQWQLQSERPTGIVSLTLTPQPAEFNRPPAVPIRMDAAVGLLQPQSGASQP